MFKNIDAKMWQEILASPKAAKEALQNLKFPEGAAREALHADGTRTRIEDLSEEQAHEIMGQLCPDWAKTKS